MNIICAMYKHGMYMYVHVFARCVCVCIVYLHDLWIDSMKAVFWHIKWITAGQGSRKATTPAKPFLGGIYWYIPLCKERQIPVL
jgi:hypothetical protein